MSKKVNLLKSIMNGVVVIVAKGYYTIIKDFNNGFVIDRNELKKGQQVNLIKLDYSRFG